MTGDPICLALQLAIELSSAPLKGKLEGLMKTHCQTVIVTDGGVTTNSGGTTPPPTNPKPPKPGGG